MKLLFEVLDEYISNIIEEKRKKIAKFSDNITAHSIFDANAASLMTAEYVKLKKILDNYNIMKKACAEISNLI